MIPHFEREVAKYEQPLPSREYILQVVEDQGKPVGFEQLCILLDIHKLEYETFQRRLAAMEREGPEGVATRQPGSGVASGDVGGDRSDCDDEPRFPQGKRITVDHDDGRRRDPVNT